MLYPRGQWAAVSATSRRGGVPLPMPHDDAGGDEPPDGAAHAALRNWRIDWCNIDERRRARSRREAGGASRDLAGELLAGGGM
mgnify:CR=1 FL=1